MRHVTAPSSVRSSRTFDGSAVVHPFAPWPLGDVRVSTWALDLSAFAAAAQP